jgi:polysaccharide chain length determinant protein (PEP-CTERM system associated)
MNEDRYMQMKEYPEDEYENGEPAKQQIDPRYYLSLLSRRRWYVIVPFCLLIIVGCLLAVKLPKIYQATTLILIQPQSVPTEYVHPVVSEGAESRISTISQQIMSRSNLENIIKQFNLYAQKDQAGMFIEDKIADLRKRITIDLSKHTKRADAEAFSVSFEGENPQKVAAVANALAANFIDENIKTRESQAVGTSNFLQDQLQSTRARLEELEKALKAYREKYMGGLPEQLDTNLKILERLQGQLIDRQTAIRDAKNRSILLNQQLAEMQNYSAVAAAAGTDGGAGMDDAVKLGQLQKQLEDLQNQYTARHPDVVRMKEKIENLKSSLAVQGTQPGADNKASGNTGPAALPMMSQSRTLLQSQQREVQNEIVSLGAEIPRLQKQIEFYERLVDETPNREQELLTLKRDYENMQKSYNSLLDRKLQAEVAVNLEKMQIGEQFRVIDYAKLPNKPVKPDMRKLFILVLAAAIGTGVGLIFLLEYLDTSFKKIEEIDTHLGLPVLATIPQMAEKKDLLWHRTNQVATTVSLLVGAVLLGAFALLAAKGVEPAKELLARFLPL